MKIIENALPLHVANTALASFPPENWQWWYRYPSGKLASADPVRIPNGCKLALDQLALALPDLPDDAIIDMDFHGAGMHVMPENCSLGTHTDAARHPFQKWSRHLSCVWFASKDIEGGELIIGEHEYRPKFNSLVMFDGSIPHSVKKVVRGVRKTLSLFVWQPNESSAGSIQAVFLKGSK